MLQPEQVKDSLHAHQLSKRGNALRVMGADIDKEMKHERPVN